MTIEEKQIHNAAHIELREFKEFKKLVRKMREAQKDVIYKSMFSALDSAHPTAYEVAKSKQIILEQEVDEYLEKREEEGNYVSTESFVQG